MSDNAFTPAETARIAEIFELARSGGAAALSELITAGLSADLTNDKGDTLLILAAYHRHPETVELLLRAGADPDRGNDRGQTALSSATFRQDEQIIHALLRAGADPDAGGQSARSVAQAFGLTAIASLFPPA